MPAWSLVFAFLAMSLPPLIANQQFVTALVLDSESLNRTLARDYASSPCSQLTSWTPEQRLELGSGSAIINGYELVWDDADYCAATKIAP